PATADVLARLPKQRLGPDDVPALQPGEAAPHPWQLEGAAPTLVTLGPGEVHLETTRVFEPSESVTVRPGTSLRMGPGASLVFLGPVHFEGQRQDPIQISALGDHPWGGIAIQGPATRGSELHGVTIQGGTRPSFRSVEYPALVDVHDTRQILIEDCHFGAHASKHDTLHFAYVSDGEIRDSSFRGGLADAVDLEYSEARLRSVQIVGPGDDGLDVMGGRVEISDSVVLGAAGNGISCGEESQVDVQNTLIADAQVGVLAKNAARVALSGSVLFRNATGVRTYQRTVRYAGPSEVTANVLFVAESSAEPVKRDDRERNTLDQGRVLLDLPRRGTLDHLLEDVLELSDWQRLPAWITDQKAQAIR
ncbi:MAG TPA: right-handed parallel beta-helix repeat-containing protein, partial [Polyangiaceae bacterium]|nr:right-handed parallel beta-helix repeat-containing protein [Polyangiaceae bacterium]